MAGRIPQAFIDELIARAGLTHMRPPFGIDSITVDGRHCSTVQYDTDEGPGSIECDMVVNAAGMWAPQVAAMAVALEKAQGPVLAYCRSGTRSTLLWALARTQLGDDKATLQDKAAQGGYDLSPIEHLIDVVAANR